jgi:phage minor structural protein
MECIFLNAAGTTLFVRDDMESGHWVQEQYNMTADFPFDASKKIERGQRIAFRDPATDVIQVFEIRNVLNQEPDHYQQITAEHICLSELSDEHINTTEITDKTAAQALTTALTGTLWSLGTSTDSTVQSADLSRGSVWDAVNTIQQNWNVYITPRVVISSAGAITARYLDITPAGGTKSGLRFSIRKNFLDPAVNYDDEGVYTALYGYGGNVDVPQTDADDKTEELTFKDQVWTATTDHPAKPAGQLYLEWPEKTALYGRNGRPRYGYYQNGNIKDAAVLLQKTWESLKASCEPKITISGTVVDLYRLGYKDQPLSLHQVAIIEIEETGETFEREIICCDIDLIDPTGSRVEIGDYIPNIVYINRDTNNKASGGGGGGGSKGSMTALEDDTVKTWTQFVKTDTEIGTIVGFKDGDAYIKAGEIILSINDDGGTTAKISADCIDIEGVVVEINASEDLIITAEHIDIQGLIEDLATESISVSELTAGKIMAQGAGVSIECEEDLDCGGSIDCGQSIGCRGSMVADTDISAGGDISADGDVSATGSGTFGSVSTGTLTATGESSLQNVTASGSVTCGSLYISGNNNSASWQSFTHRTYTTSNSHYFDYTDSGGSGTVNGRLITGSSDTTIYYLGHT